MNYLLALPLLFALCACNSYPKNVTTAPTIYDIGQDPVAHMKQLDYMDDEQLAGLAEAEQENKAKKNRYRQPYREAKPTEPQASYNKRWPEAFEATVNEDAGKMINLRGQTGPQGRGELENMQPGQIHDTMNGSKL